jgi:Spy/CpxP family protein refolding chaperone
VLVPSTCCWFQWLRQGPLQLADQKKCNRAGEHPVILSESAKSAEQKIKKGKTEIMKRNVLILAAAGAIALGGFVAVQAQPDAGGAGCGHGHAFGLNHLTEKLNLTSDQQAKVQPILDQAKPQIVAIHQEAMQKMHTVMDSALSQVRPLLNADQQKKLDAIQKAHQDMLNAKKELHNAMQD